MIEEFRLKKIIYDNLHEFETKVLNIIQLYHLGISRLQLNSQTLPSCALWITVDS